ncbi:MAG: pilus assembly protein [Bdellovibrionaceae bacterium]|nr:pilus assembly protein [Pseudobdellovibrionaceae bacterium]
MTKVFLLPFFVFPSFSNASDLLLVLGEEKALPQREQRLWIETPARLKGIQRNGRIVLKPLKEGRVQIRTTSGPQAVEILSPKAHRTFLALKKTIPSLVGPELRIQDGEVLLEGRLHRIADYRSLISALPAEASWTFKARMSSEVQDDFSREIQTQLSMAQPPALVFNDEVQWLLSPGVGSPALPQKQIQRLGIRLVTDSESVNTEPVIRVEIAVAEVRRDALKNYGVGFPTSIQAKLLPDGSWEKGDLGISAQAMEKAGHGRLLAKPTLLCRSGKEAEFVAGGEFPIKIFNDRIQDVIWKKYGIVVTVKPKADRAGRMSLSVSVEVSSIDDSRQVDGIPGLLTNRVASHFDLSRPRVIALSGLIKQEDGNSHQGLLGLSQLPILGPLFSSRSWREHRTELVIFVRPEIVKEIIE